MNVQVRQCMSCSVVYKINNETTICCGQPISKLFLCGVFTERAYCTECDKFYGREGLAPQCHAPTAMKRWCLLDLSHEYATLPMFECGMELFKCFKNLVQTSKKIYAIRDSTAFYEEADIIVKHLPLLEKFPESAEWQYVKKCREELLTIIAKWKFMDAIWKSLDGLSEKQVKDSWITMKQNSPEVVEGDLIIVDH